MTTTTMTIEAAVVVGAGTMGHGIAQVLAQAGVKVTLVDRELSLVQAGIAKIAKSIDVAVAKGKLAADQAAPTLARITGDTTMAAMADAHLVIEAIPEKMELKQALFADADARAPRSAILASNTSSLSITAIASSTTHRDRVVGLHFFNPVPIMKLLEIVRGAATTDAVVDVARTLAMRMNKTAIVVNDAPGFATSRLGVAIGLEAIRMLEEGVASAADIDAAMTLGYGHPMGPLQLTDLVGLDVRLAIAEAMHAETNRDSFFPPRLLRRLVRAGHLGKKSGRGFYVWEGDKPVAPANDRG